MYAAVLAKRKGEVIHVKMNHIEFVSVAHDVCQHRGVICQLIGGFRIQPERLCASGN
jgi:hypothetical protein